MLELFIPLYVSATTFEGGHDAEVALSEHECDAPDLPEGNWKIKYW